jgi:hypothetical protein
MDRRILIVTSPEQAAARVWYQRLLAMQISLMLTTSAASAAVDISRIGA